MSYVFLSHLLPSNPEIELNDVGVVQGDGISFNSYSVKFLRANAIVELDKNFVTRFKIEETGDRYQFKICDRCFKHLDTATLFQDNRIKKGGVITKRPSCKMCRLIKDGKSISAVDKILWDLKKPKNYSAFTCPICMKTTIAGITKVVLDHNHETGKVRGWLCESCNTGIGRFDDKQEIIWRALDWLDETKSTDP